MIASEALRQSVGAVSPLLRPHEQQPSKLRVYLYMMRQLAITSFKLKYAGSALGYVWSLVKPLMIFGMVYAVFALFLLRGQTRGESYAAELLLGIIVWTFFAEATAIGLAAIVYNADMVRKAYFPRWVLVVSSSLSSAMSLGVNLGLLFIAGLFLHWFSLGLQTLLMIPLLIELYVVVVGLGLFLSAFYVYFRDMGHIWEVILQALFFGSAILFPFYLIPQRFQTIVVVNPVAQIVEDMRRALISPTAPWSTDILHGLEPLPFVLAGVFLAGGVVVFRRLSRRFGENL